MIEFRNVYLKYHYEKYPLFEDLSFTLQQGVNTVLCDMQSGKTSLCKMILGELAPNGGSVWVDGKNLYPQNRKEKPRPNALYLPSNPVFFDNKTVKYNLEYPLKVRRTLSQNVNRVAELAERFCLTELLNVKVKNLNLRQKKLLALARGLTVRRNIVLLDGFFDDNEMCEELSQASVLPLFEGETVAVFTVLPQMAVGNTVVIDDKKCAFCGTSSEAAKFVDGLTWLSSLNVDK